MKVLITGGAGFIGHHLVQALLANTDWDITILDRASNRFGIIRLEKLGILESKRVSLIRSDFSTENFDLKNSTANDFNFIFHLGAKTSVNESALMPDAYISSNVVGTQKMLEFASHQKNLISFVYFSTNEIFGPGTRDKAFKEWSPYNCQSIYAATKASGEELVLACSIQHGIPILVIHTMNVFGEFEIPEKFIPQIIKSVLKEEPIPIFFQEKTGMGGRTYLDIQILMDAILFLLHGLISGNLLSTREKINIAGEEYIDNDKLAMRVTQIMEKPFKMKLVGYFDEHPGHILETALDISKLRNLGWLPKSSFDDGLKRIVAWWLANPSWLNQIW